MFFLLNLLWNVMMIFFPFSEGRRCGKTVIIAKNIQESSDNDESGSDAEEENSSSDESMTDGHPAKKPKIG